VEVPLPPPGPPAFPCSACSAFLNSRDARNKHHRKKTTHKPPSGNVPLHCSSGRATKKPRVPPPTEASRDQALGREKWAAVGRREIDEAREEKRAAQVASKSRTKEHLISHGTLTTNEHVFDGKVASRLNEDLPLLLKDARTLEGAEKCTGKGTDCGAVLMEHVKAPFIACEMEIARLNAHPHHRPTIY
jgi:hypothetical protein